MEVVGAIFSQFLFAVPLIVVWLVGLVFAVSRRRRRPRQSFLLILAFCALILSTLIGSFTPALLLTFVEAARTGALFATVGFLTTLLSLAAWILVLVALFGKQDDPAVAPDATTEGP